MVILLKIFQTNNEFKMAKICVTNLLSFNFLSSPPNKREQSECYFYYLNVYILKLSLLKVIKKMPWLLYSIYTNNLYINYKRSLPTFSTNYNQAKLQIFGNPPQLTHTKKLAKLQNLTTKLDNKKKKQENFCDM